MGCSTKPFYLGRLGFMKQRRAGFALVVLVGVCVVDDALCAEQGRQEEGRSAEERNPEHRQDRRRCRGRPAGAERPVADVGARGLLKAQGNKEYVPFTVRSTRRRSAAAPSRSTGASSRRAPPPPPVAEPGKKDDKKDDKDKARSPDYAYEDISFVPVTAGPDVDADLALVHRAGRQLRRVRRSRRSRRRRRRRRTRRRRRCRCSSRPSPCPISGTTS